MPFYKMLRSKTRKTVHISPLRPSLPDPPLPVPENEKILVWVGDELVPRNDAKVHLEPLNFFLFLLVGWEEGAMLSAYVAWMLLES